MTIIKIDQLTKDFGHGRGIFDINLEVGEGEVFGFLGPNGAGKTTTIRHLMGFTKPDTGSSVILDKNTTKYHASVLKDVGYLPGEVTLPESLTGLQFLKMMQDMKGVKDTSRLTYLLDKFELNADAPTKRMSIGEKRKLAVIAAFMHDPKVLILDEPTSGLDPVMQEEFINFMLEEKARGKTILLSSHIFSEVDALADRIAIIKEGKIVSQFNAADVKETTRKTFEISFRNQSDYTQFKTENVFEVVENNQVLKQVVINIKQTDLSKLVNKLVNFDIQSLIERPFTLESYFMHFYKSGRSFGGVGNGK